MKTPLIPLTIFLSLTLAACGAAATAGPGSPATEPAAVESTPTPVPVGTATPDPMVARIVALVKVDLARRESIEPDEIVLLNGERVEWPDSSLGCPEPDTFYAQVVTPGYLILLKTEQDVYQYHTDERGDEFVLCDRNADSPFQPIPLTPGEIQDGEPWQPVE
jgi:hypothetical protein